MRVQEPPIGTFFRSEEIALCQLFIQPEAAYASISELGEAGTVQFRDLNPEVNAFNRKFVNEVRRCDEMHRKLRYIEAELTKDSVAIPDLDDISYPLAPNPRELINLEARFEKTENEILELSQNAVNLKSNFLELTELRHVLIKTHGFFDEQHERRHTMLLHPNRGQSRHHEPSVVNNDGESRLGFVAGVIQRERVAGFERMLWRISRGNVFLRQAELDEPLEDPVSGDQLHKTVFVAFFQGEELKSRIKKVCTGYHASIYPCPSDYEERDEMLAGVQTRLADLQLVLNQTQDHRQRVLVSVAKDLRVWNAMVFKMKAIYHTLNLFNMDLSQKCLIGECWVPVNDLALVRQALVVGSESVGSTIQSFLNLIEYDEAPPTFNRVNKFTKCFQVLIDSYGVATNGEANPALYTIVTFPFLFSVMFGDLGHGFILTLFGLWMVLWEKSLAPKKDASEMWIITFGGRYIILMMGLFSCYTGIVYNDVFSMSMNIFGSSWRANVNVSRLGDEFVTLDPANGDLLDSTYPIGLDPVWQLGKNKIQFLNTYKMKLSIIIGVLHMIFGVCMSVVNMRFFRRKEDIVLQFVPQVIFLVVLFGYMVFLMFFKWVAYGPKMDDFQSGINCAPSILITFINMMLFKKDPTPEGCVGEMFRGQDIFQYVLVALALVCVPWMLFAKPVYVMQMRKKKAMLQSTTGETNMGIELSEEDEAHSSASSAKVHHTNSHDDEPLGEIFIHQAIHTIEYALSTISHTASYLRLWALSLAHAQLSDVLWDILFRKGLLISAFLPTPLNGLIVFLVFAAWATLTITILVLMEGLSAFLHTLRLHWVEFMSKFYAGTGYAFEPFSFQGLIDAADESAVN